MAAFMTILKQIHIWVLEKGLRCTNKYGVWPIKARKKSCPDRVMPG